ncbi:MAG: PTS sugar transporter subunit IIA [Candidatus Binatus sp.]|uniref:PTS sugar transporter subunit IIA n=1 Tax=Candidatus Binatus sp. TaxID=2811406 RepID=UPI003C78B58D
MHLNVREASKLLQVSEKKVYDWIRRGILRADRVNDQYRLHRSDLLERTSSREIDIPAQIFEAPSSAGVFMPRLAEALNAGGIFYGLQGDDKAAVLGVIVNSLALPSNTDRESLAQLLLAREALGSTAIGEGIAIPHVRRPILLNTSSPAISLCFLEKPVDFGAFDGQPVFAIFLLISPTARMHLHLLSRLSFALHDSQLKAALVRRAARDEILAEFERVERAMKEPHVEAEDHA